MLSPRRSVTLGELISIGTLRSLLRKLNMCERDWNGHKGWVEGDAIIRLSKGVNTPDRGYEASTQTCERKHSE